MARVEGHVEAVERSQVRGWAADFDAPGQRIEVELLLDGRRLSLATADAERPDLTVLELGQTACGFALPVPAGTAIDMRGLRVRCTQSGVELPVSDQAWLHEGMIEKVENMLVSGWAWRTGMPQERVRILVRHRGEVLAKGYADEYREDLANAGVGDGRHGFVVSLRTMWSSSFDAADVDVVFEATGAPLMDLRAGARPQAVAATPAMGITRPAALHRPRKAVPAPAPAPEPEPVAGVVVEAPRKPVLSLEAIEAINGAIDLGEENLPGN